MSHHHHTYRKKSVVVLATVLPDRQATPAITLKKRPASLRELSSDDERALSPQEEIQPRTAKRARRRYAQVAPLNVPRPSGFSLLVQWFQELVNQSSYGKNLPELLSPQKNFKVFSTNGDVFLSNYGELPTDKPPFKGVCNDLSYMVGRYLQQHIGRDYVIQAARGQCDDYYSNGTHIFLLLWPNQQQLQMESRLACANGKIPKECYLVDPSFQRVLPPEDEGFQRGRYRLQRLLTMEEINPTTSTKDVSVRADQMPTWYPLGYVNELMPQVLNGQGLLFFGFQRPFFSDDSPALDFMVMPTTDDRYQLSALSWVDALPEEHVLRQFQSRIRMDLADDNIRRLLPFLFEDSLENFSFNNTQLPMPGLEAVNALGNLDGQQEPWSSPEASPVLPPDLLPNAAPPPPAFNLPSPAFNFPLEGVDEAFWDDLAQKTRLSLASPFLLPEDKAADDDSAPDEALKSAVCVR